MVFDDGHDHDDGSKNQMSACLVGQSQCREYLDGVKLSCKSHTLPRLWADSGVEFNAQLG